MNDPSPILRVEGLSKRYGRFEALRELSFSLAEGETLGLLGRNGAGKSTTIKILCNLIRPTSGQAWLDGRPILGGKGVEHRRVIGAVIEAPRFYPHLSGRRNLSLLARLSGVARERVDAMLEQVGLGEWGAVRFERYSTGMKQRLGLAAAFLHAPRLAILDEPTSGLDPVGQRQVRDLIRTLAQGKGVSVLLCSHLLEEVGELCDRALVIERGGTILERSLRDGEGLEAVRRCFRELAGEDGESFAPAGAGEGWA